MMSDFAGEQNICLHFNCQLNHSFFPDIFACYGQNLALLKHYLPKTVFPANVKIEALSFLTHFENTAAAGLSHAQACIIGQTLPTGLELAFEIAPFFCCSLSAT